MRVLVVKTSSLGDVIHTLPALTDAAKVNPNIEFDWIVEEPFQMIPAWHRNVRKVIPIAFRRWRKEWFKAALQGEMKQTLKKIRAESYDLVIDAQGLLKSVMLSYLARGKRMGFSWTSAREPLASIFYHRRAIASWSLHAVPRLRLLFAESLGYSYTEDIPDYGIDTARFLKESKSSNSNNNCNDDFKSKSNSNSDLRNDPYCVFLHGTTWETKHWPENHWIELGKRVAQSGYKIKLMWGNAAEELRAKRIAAAVGDAVLILPKQTLNEVALVLAQAEGIVSVDTGLGHLAAAFGIPTVSLYSASDSVLTGLMGPNQLHLSVKFPCAPCFKRTCLYSKETPDAIHPPCFTSILPEHVWQQLQSHMNKT